MCFRSPHTFSVSMCACVCVCVPRNGRARQVTGRALRPLLSAGVAFPVVAAAAMRHFGHELVDYVRLRLANGLRYSPTRYATQSKHPSSQAPWVSFDAQHPLAFHAICRWICRSCLPQLCLVSQPHFARDFQMTFKYLLYPFRGYTNFKRRLEITLVDISRKIYNIFWISINKGLKTATLRPWRIEPIYSYRIFDSAWTVDFSIQILWQ